jgi:UDP-glucose 4-epimerase
MDTRRDFMFVGDLIDLVERAVDGRGASGVYHASSGSDSSIKELYDAVVEAIGMPPHDVEVRPRPPDDAFTILLDPSRTESEFDWRASTPLREGVAAAVEYYREYGVEETFTHLRIAKD